ncbi:hypothetical protein HDU96_004585 [Phlyctochytrium bullatum]|nr:hypothetical protein HDU96_004585 [Phlyctochytrium bullatum]
MFPRLREEARAAESASGNAGPEEDRINEERAYNKVLKSFKNYRQHALGMNDKRRRDFAAIPEAHRKLVPEYGRRLAMVDQRILKNAEFVDMMLEGQGDPEVPIMGPDGKHIEPEPVMESDMDKVRSTLKQFVRDWSVEGQVERDATYKPIVDALLKYYKDLNEHQRGDITVLVPGAGLARLAYDIVKLGAYSMVTHEMMTHEIFPWVHSFSNLATPDHQLRGVKIPDVYPGNIPENASFSMVAGDFLEVYSQKDQLGQWDAVVTCYFIDTAKNIIHYLETIANALAPGGYWINMGPLLYHFEGMKSEKSVDLNLEEVKLVASRLGFEFLEERWFDSTYTGNPQTMLQYVYKCAFWVARKKGGEIQPRRGENGKAEVD